MPKFSILLALLILVCSASALTDSVARARLNAAGITVSSSGNCSNRRYLNCTSLDGILENTIAGLINLKRAKPKCGINVTRGAEVGHSSKSKKAHAKGYKAVISLNDCVNSYMTGNFAYPGVRRDRAPMYRSLGGDIYAKEGNHWDIEFN